MSHTNLGIIVPNLSTKDGKEISNSFMLTRKGYEENKQNVTAAMFLATAYDKASEAWTRFSPNVLVGSSFKFNLVA